MKKADFSWFHFYRSVIQSGDLAKMSGNAVKAYLVIKCLCDIKDGNSGPSFSEIQEMSGIASKTTLSSALKELSGLGYVRSISLGKGKANIYRVVERFVDEEKGQVICLGYVPTEQKEAISEAIGYAVNGKVPDGGFKYVNIENLHLHIHFHQTDKTVVVDSQAMPPDKQKKFWSNLRKRLEGQITDEDILVDLED